MSKFFQFLREMAFYFPLFLDPFPIRVLKKLAYCKIFLLIIYFWHKFALKSTKTLFNLSKTHLCSTRFSETFLFLQFFVQLAIQSILQNQVDLLVVVKVVVETQNVWMSKNWKEKINKNLNEYLKWAWISISRITWCSTLFLVIWDLKRI